MVRATRNIGFPKSDFHWVVTIRPSPLAMRDWLSSYFATGVIGDPVFAGFEKVWVIFNAVIENLTALINEFREREQKPRQDHH